MQNSINDKKMVEMIGSYIKYNRLQQNKSQSQLAEEAGVHRNTLTYLENGKRANIITLIQLLRALDLLSVLQPFEVQQQISPIQLAELELAKRKRASKIKATEDKTQSDW